MSTERKEKLKEGNIERKKEKNVIIDKQKKLQN